MPRKVTESVRPIDAVVEAFRAKRRQHEVPEWGLTLYFGPITAYEMEEVGKRAKGKGQFEQNIILLIYKARNAEGRPVFEMGDKEALKNEADLTVLQRLVNFMWDGVSDAKERVEADPTSSSV